MLKLPAVILTHAPFPFPEPWPQPILWSISVIPSNSPGGPEGPRGPGSPPTGLALEKLVSRESGQSSPVPEPAPLLLIGAGLLALRLVRR